MLSRARGNSPDNIDQSPESLEKDIIRCMEILGEAKVVDLVALCNWNYSLPTAEEQAETAEMVKKQTKEN